jgi:hypothetical protein
MNLIFILILNQQKNNLKEKIDIYRVVQFGPKHNFFLFNRDIEEKQKIIQTFFFEFAFTYSQTEATGY